MGGYRVRSIHEFNRAISAIHAKPGHDWNVIELAKLSNLSRSAFADHFQRIVGQAPMAYLTAWRLDRAAELLRYSRAQVSEIASHVGYTSEAAFSRAFKSRFAMSPLHWRRTDYISTEGQAPETPAI